MSEALDVRVTPWRPLYDRVAPTPMARMLFEAEIARQLQEAGLEATVQLPMLAPDEADRPVVSVTADGIPCPFPVAIVAEALAYAQGTAQVLPDDAAVRSGLLGLDSGQTAEVLALICREAISTHGPAPSALLDADPAGAPPSITVHVAPGYLRSVTNAVARRDQDLEVASRLFPALRDGLFAELGVVLPLVRLRPDHALRPGAFSIEVSGRRRLPRIGLPSDTILAASHPDADVLTGLAVRPALSPGWPQPSTLVSAEHRPYLTDQGVTTWDHTEYLSLSVAAAVRQHAQALVTRAEAAAMIERLAPSWPALAAAARRHVPDDVLAPVLRELLFSQVSIRNLRRILELLLRYEAEGGRGDRLVFVRRGLGDAIAEKFSWNKRLLVAYLLDGDAEQVIADYAAPADGTDFGRARARERLSAAIRAELALLSPSEMLPVLLIRDDLRRPLSHLIRPEFPWLTVLGYGDLPAGHDVRPRSRISVG